MYISNNANILPVCNIRVEICLYIIIALPRLILFSIPSSLFLTWCSYIKYLSKLKLQCSRSVCWLGGGRRWRGSTLTCVYQSHSCWNKQKKNFIGPFRLSHASLPDALLYSVFPSCGSDVDLYHTFEIKYNIQFVIPLCMMSVSPSDYG